MNHFNSDDTIEDDLTMRLTGNYRKNFTKFEVTRKIINMVRHFDQKISGQNSGHFDS